MNLNPPLQRQFKVTSTAVLPGPEMNLNPPLQRPFKVTSTTVLPGPEMNSK